MKKLCVLVLAFAMAGCGGLHAQYVESDREDYKVFAPLIEKWLDNEPGVAIDPNWDLAEDYVEVLRLKLKSRNAKITRAEQFLAEENEGE